jgi:hypothetical protein
VAFAGVGRTAVGASRSLARPTRRRLRALVVIVAPGHWSGAARCVLGQWPAASHLVCAPAHPCASPLRGISPARWSARPPPVGAPSARAPAWLLVATGFVACHAWNTGATGLTACKPAWPLAYLSRAMVVALAIYLIAVCARSTRASGLFFIWMFCAGAWTAIGLAADNAHFAKQMVGAQLIRQTSYSGPLSVATIFIVMEL